MWAILFLVGIAVGVPYGLAEFAFHRAALRSALPLFRRKQAPSPPAELQAIVAFDDRREPDRSQM
jgi:hypothetical protein